MTNLTNLAQRADNHNYHFDPIIRSLLDTDFYKFPMLQLVFFHFPDVKASFKVINRTLSFKIADYVPIEAVRQQIEHVTTLSFKQSDQIYLSGNKFYGKRDMFKPEFIDFLSSLKLKMPEISIVDGQYEIHITGLWMETMLWEIYILAIMNELKSRAGLSSLNKIELDVLYARGISKIWNKLNRLKGIPGFTVAEFGTRRRHSFLWQERVLQIAQEVLGSSLIGTSNVFLAQKYSMEAIGTNAHELTMAITALADEGILDCSVQNAPYKVLELWQEMYGELLIFLPDTYGTSGFFNNAPDFVWDWKGLRVDSKNPFVAGEEYISKLQEKGKDPKTKLILFSDGLDVDEMIQLYAQFGGEIQPGYTKEDFKCKEDFLNPLKWKHEPRIKVSFGWGTMFTNDFKDCNPQDNNILDPISIVCKIYEVNGRGAVKLSDNWNKATGQQDDIEKYRKYFGSEGVEGRPVTV